MTNLMKNILVAAAALMVAGVASAQTVQADIPFAFRAGEKLMAPGTYLVNTVSAASGIAVFKLYNTDERAGVLALPPTRHDPAREWKADGKPRLVFLCGGSRCALAEIWRGAGETISYKFNLPKYHEELRAEVIVGRPVRSE